jgi:hypothetical protein
MPEAERQPTEGIYPRSIIEHQGTTYSLCGIAGEKMLVVSGSLTDPETGAGFSGTSEADGATYCPLTHANAVVLRQKLPWLRPVPLGLHASVGFGDRLGLATPGHVRAVRKSGLLPIFAQQSVRENARTGFTPQQVLDNAMWGVFQEGWRGDWGADADHVKSKSDLAPFVDAGYSFFTIDPSEVVDPLGDSVQEIAQKRLVNLAHSLPWKALDITLEQLYRLYLGQSFKLLPSSKPNHIDELTLTFDEGSLLTACIKYVKALAQVREMHDHLLGLMNDRLFELEISLDETKSPTSLLEHFYFVSELKRLEVPFISLALRFVGRFEKGVDYIGDVAVFTRELKEHVMIMRYFDGYKLSLHSGSDKFSIYPPLAALAGECIHLKTAGTSYLEALRLIAKINPELFRQILEFARQSYRKDRRTYQVSAQIDRLPKERMLSNADLPDLLNQFDTRQVLHVSFGSVIDRFGIPIKSILDKNEELYYQALERHFVHHLAPFDAVLPGSAN